MRHKNSVAPFDLAFRTLFSELQELATTQQEIPAGSWGSLSSEERAGKRYWYWRKYDAAGEQVREYLGADDDPGAAARVEEIRHRLEDGRRIGELSDSLRRQGYAAADSSTAAALAVLHSAGVFRAGSVLVGTHAYGVILNTLGFQQPSAYRTEDIDLAQSARLAITLPSLREAGLLEVLKRSGLPFAEVPGFEIAEPATSFKVRGKPLRVDLLTPAARTGQKPVRVEGLGAYATPLRYLDYLIGKPMRTALIAKAKAIPVNVPSPARFALHKLLTAALRPSAMAGKIEKDLKQAEFVGVALSESREFELEEEISTLPAAIRKKIQGHAASLAEKAKDNHPEFAAILSRIENR
jgi:hypothetical protein